MRAFWLRGSFGDQRNEDLLIGWVDCDVDSMLVKS